MRRRALLLAAGGLVAAVATRSYAQGAKPKRVAVLLPYAKTHSILFEAFRRELKERGQVEGRDVLLDVRWADNKPERFQPLAAELIARKPDVILTATTAGVRACKEATSSIPIVFATAFNPVEQGFVSSLRNPAGNVTGVIVYADLTPKLAEIARDAFPGKRRLGLLVNDTDPAHIFVMNAFENGAKRFKFEPQIVRVARAEDFERAFAELVRLKVDAVIIPQLSLFTGNSRQLAQQAIAARMPILSSQTFITEDGGLLSYGTLTEENYQRAAALVDKILRGAKPADLPVDQPEKFKLIINMKTAKAIGATPSKAVLTRADRLIE